MLFIYIALFILFVFIVYTYLFISAGFVLAYEVLFVWFCMHNGPLLKTCSGA